MLHILDLALYAPIPVGHRVSVVPLERMGLALFGGPTGWDPMNTPLVCDEVTRIIYSDLGAGLAHETTYEHIRFRNERVRISMSQPPIRGVVRACLALYDHGDRVDMHTVLHIDDGPVLT